MPPRLGRDRLDNRVFHFCLDFRVWTWKSPRRCRAGMSLVGISTIPFAEHSPKQPYIVGYRCREQTGNMRCSWPSWPLAAGRKLDSDFIPIPGRFVTLMAAFGAGVTEFPSVEHLTASQRRGEIVATSDILNPLQSCRLISRCSTYVPAVMLKLCKARTNGRGSAARLTAAVWARSKKGGRRKWAQRSNCA